MPSTTNATKAAKAIKKIKQEVLWPETVDAPKSFQYYKIGKDYMRRLSYVTCKILAENVNEGTDPSKETKGYIQAIGCSDDELSYIIPKSLGGCGERFNVFPQTAALKHGKREQDETKVREYLKSGENKSATLTFGLEYSTKTEEEEEEETLTCHLRPTKLYYHYALYNGNSLSTKLGEELDNTSSNERERLSGICFVDKLRLDNTN